MIQVGITTYYPSVKRVEKLTKREILDLTFDLINAFRIVKSPIETAFLIQDLLTANEIRNLAVRLRIAKLLLAGDTQRDISKSLHCSLATVSKVSAWINRGGEGLKNVISKLPQKYGLPNNLPKIPIEFQLPQAILALAQYSIAKRQNKLVENVWEEIEDKRLLDKQLREMFRQEFGPSKKKRKISP